MKNRPATAGFAIWISLILPFLAACGGSEPAINAAHSKAATIEEPALVVREWYPRPKQTSRSTVQFVSPPEWRQNVMPQQTGSVGYGGPVTSQPVFAEDNRVIGQQSGVNPWSPNPVLHQSANPQENWAIPGQQYQQRPWGETTHAITADKRTPRTRTRGVIVPYGASQRGFTVYPGYPYAGVPYGAFPGTGYPGFIW